MSELLKCPICGKEYKACRKCKDVKNLHPWRMVTDTIEHYKMFLILQDYNTGHISAEKAAAQLVKIEYDPKVLRDGVRKNVDEILSSKREYDVKQESKKPAVSVVKRDFNEKK